MFSRYLGMVLLSVALLAASLPAPCAQPVTFEGAVTNQVIDGFGANINHRGWNNDGELRPVVDALVDQAGMTLFRVIYDKTDWEATNENSSPYVMYWSYYDQIYNCAEFQKMWGLMGYFNQKGISNGLMLNFQGNGPAWLGSPALNTGLEPEWAQMIASLLIYAAKTNNLAFSLVGPDNEMDETAQGVNMTATQYTNALHILSQDLDSNGMSGLRFVGPDMGSGGTNYMPQMLGDPVVMSKVAHFGLHSYASEGGGSAGVASYIQSTAYSNRTIWMTEFNVWCPQCDAGVTGTNTWSYASGAVAYLCAHLANGVSGGLVWEAYDSQYNYYNPLEWSFWGLFAVVDTNAVVKTYTPRTIFYTLSQVTKWVRPGAQMIQVGGSIPSALSPLQAFKNTGLRQVTIIGINNAASVTPLSGVLTSLPAITNLDLYYTSPVTNLAYAGPVAVTNGAFSASIPSNCVFTLTGIAGAQAAITNPPTDTQLTAPATIPIFADAETTAGFVTNVQFFNGSSSLYQSTDAPYQFTWTNVPMGDYALTAVATDTMGSVGTSAVVRVSVVGPIAQIAISPAGAAVIAGSNQQFVATALDALGHVIVPQPAFTWSNDYGGIISGAGVFTAGQLAGGPFNIIAVSGGISATSTVSILPIAGKTNAPVTWAAPAPIVYGTPLSGTQLDASSSLAGVFTYNPPAGAILGAGLGQELTLTFLPQNTNTYAGVITNVPLNVLQQTLVITANSTNNTFGAAIPSLTVSYSGFVNGETPAVLSALPVVSTTATAESDPGAYPLTPSGAAALNYAIQYRPGTLTVIPASVAGVLEASANPVLLAAPVTFTYSLNAVAPGVGTPAGTVNFRFDGAATAMPAGLSGGTASYTTATLPPGRHVVQAEYAGTLDFFGTTNVLASGELVLPQPALSISDMNAGSFVISFNGVPGETYSVEFTPTFDNPEWIAIGTSVADASGVVRFTNTPAQGPPSGFYRAVYP